MSDICRDGGCLQGGEIDCGEEQEMEWQRRKSGEIMQQGGKIRRGKMHSDDSDSPELTCALRSLAQCRRSFEQSFVTCSCSSDMWFEALNSISLVNIFVPHINLT